MSFVEKLRIRNPLLRQFFAEFLGTFVLIVLGDGAVAQMVLTDKALGGYLSVNFGYAMAVAFGVYVSGGVSGGHINPAVTLVMAVIGEWLINVGSASENFEALFTMLGSSIPL